MAFKKLLFLTFSFCCLLFSTACTTSSGVMQMGPDTYTISSGGALTGTTSGNDIKSKRKAYADANAFCASLGKQILVENTNTQTTGFGSTSDLIFKCLSTEDYQYQRPQYQKTPDVVIENRNN